MLNNVQAKDKRNTACEFGYNGQNLVLPRVHLILDANHVRLTQAKIQSYLSN